MAKRRTWRHASSTETLLPDDLKAYDYRPRTQAARAFIYIVYMIFRNESRRNTEALNRIKGLQGGMFLGFLGRTYSLTKRTLY